MIFWLLLLLGIVICIVMYRRSLYLPADKNKIILVSGCDTGFGYLIALELSQKGCTVLAGCLTDPGVESLASLNRKNLFPFKLDITNQESVAYCKTFAEKHCGELGLWALINNAGIGAGGNIDMISLQSVRNVFEVNLFGHCAMTQALLPLVKKRKGRIINMVSMAGRDMGTYGAMSYFAVKRALNAFNDCLRLELHSRGILVIAIEPGFMKTNIISTENIQKFIFEQKKKRSPRSP